jgi:hypothetical protein
MCLKNLFVVCFTLSLTYILLPPGPLRANLQPDDPSLVGVWLFDEGAGDLVADASANGNDGFILAGGDDYVWEDGKFGTAIVSPGDGSIDVDESDSLAEIAEAMTVAAWFRVDADSDTGVRKQGSFLLEDQSGSEPFPDAFVTCFWTDTGVNCFFGQTELDQEVWNHVAATYDGEFVEMYINGEPESAVGFLTGSGDPVEPELSGDIQPGAGNPLQLKYGPESYIGGIDEVAIFNRALSQDEIKDLMGGFENLGGGVARLQAGDADQDLDFDQLDLVKVQIAAKYLAGSAATWGEGDWDGAPGGQPGAPPAGDGVFNQLDIIAALSTGLYLTGPYGAVASSPAVKGDSQTSIVYDPSTGEMAVDAPAGVELTSINVDSASGIFTGGPAENLGGSFDNDDDGNIFKATFGGSFGSVSFGPVAQPGLSKQFVLDDLSVVGSLAGGGDLGDVDLIYVPEPCTSGLLLIGVAMMIRLVTRERMEGPAASLHQRHVARVMEGPKARHN